MKHATLFHEQSKIELKPAQTTLIMLMSIILLSMDREFNFRRISLSPYHPPRSRSPFTGQMTTLLRLTPPTPDLSTVERQSLLKKRVILMAPTVVSAVITTWT